MSQGRHRQMGEPVSAEVPGQRFSDVLDANLKRRGLLKGMLALPIMSGFTLTALTGCSDGDDPAPETPPVSLDAKFKALPVTREDRVVVAEGYTAAMFMAWGDPVSNGPAWNGSNNSAAEQELQMGMHHDGMHFFPFPYGSESNTRGLIAVNHEYTGNEYLFPAGTTFSAAIPEQLNKALAAVGVSIVEVQFANGQWSVVRPSTFGRRVTGLTPIRVSGAAKEAPQFRTSFNPTGATVKGTMINCGSGPTPWGTYLTCEETTSNPYDTTQPAETQGWVTEIDPFEPSSPPVKRTSMGRFAHENAAFTIGANSRVVFYMGDDGRFQCLYKFVTNRGYDASVANRAANRDLLDDGVLYVAKLNDDGSGVWVPLIAGQGALTSTNGYANQADVLVKCRAAAIAAGGTQMDRPEWFTVNPKDKAIYVTLTNNTQRGGTAAGQLPANGPNPRNNNVDGHILKMIEAGSDPLSLTFRWEIFLLAGNPALTETNRQGNIKGDILSSPDGLRVDPFGRMWIQCDYDATSTVMQSYGNCAMLHCNPETKQVTRFLTGPNGCEITGIAYTPDMKTMWINIQHPGEDKPGTSTWPHGNPALPPRSGTVIIRKNDGGVIGA
jgi:uncharacterized protein